MGKLVDVDRDDVLRYIGLQRMRRGVVLAMFPALAMLLVGAAVGAGVGMMITPTTRLKLRQGVRDKVSDLRDRFKTKVEARVDGETAPQSH
jgi:hypothetical protein